MVEIIRTYEDLEALIKKNYVTPDLTLVKKGYELASLAHEGETRFTGHPFITHPLAVAYKLAEMGFNLNMIVAGLLHDVIEDSEKFSVEDLRREFGDDITGLVDGVTKLKKIKYQGVERYVENMRKMFLAMASDVRVVFIKFADRLHNLQTLYARPAHKQERVARETLEIYAPIANRLGMGEVKGEMEDLSFKYLYPKEYDWTQQIMDTKVREKGVQISRLMTEVENALKTANISSPQIHGRVKRLFSLYKKLQKHKNDVNRIYDLIAIRVVVNDVEDCYATLGIIHQRWHPMPNRIKDYIAQPKPNGYQSLHTTIFCDDGEVAEFQIRTAEMHELSEYGVAAHWMYKETGRTPPKNLQWMEDLVAIQKQLAAKKDFLEQMEILKIDVFKDRIFLFTPQGDVIDLPEGATPVDFAFAVHTDLGNKCVAVEINDQIANLDTPLNSGDVVKIITDKNRRGPNPDWLKFAKTHHARECIKAATRRGMKSWLTAMIPKPQFGSKKRKNVKL
ncbi:MAG: RelA/SpoT family protein [Candidatus Uhrbacteria bacterium]